MLVLSRKKNQQIVIDGRVTVTVLDVRGNTVRLGIEAPVEVSIHREEILHGSTQAADYENRNREQTVAAAAE
jgi:carbon storage regulator